MIEDAHTAADIAETAWRRAQTEIDALAIPATWVGSAAQAARGDLAGLVAAVDTTEARARALLVQLRRTLAEVEARS